MKLPSGVKERNLCVQGNFLIRSCFKIVFWPNVFVGASFKILEILMYACGLGPQRG
jgi:hypothetical protein